MRIHKEGWVTIILTGFLIALIIATINYFHLHILIQVSVLLILAVFYFIIFYFFRNPHRPISALNNNTVYAPADGTVVVIEETDEPEYFKKKCMQISIFMSPLNVHVNRYSVGGTVSYCKYHPGKYLVAWHPKSSVLNERSTTVLKTNDGKEILIRQIAGAVARRVVTYAKQGMTVTQGDDLGFIKFGSRVDILLPAGTKVSVNLNQKVKGNITVLAEL